jgi:hypothetical protein
MVLLPSGNGGLGYAPMPAHGTDRGHGRMCRGVFKFVQLQGTIGRRARGLKRTLWGWDGDQGRSPTCRLVPVDRAEALCLASMWAGQLAEDVDHDRAARGVWQRRFFAVSDLFGLP